MTFVGCRHPSWASGMCLRCTDCGRVVSSCRRIPVVEAHINYKKKVLFPYYHFNSVLQAKNEQGEADASSVMNVRGLLDCLPTLFILLFIHTTKGSLATMHNQLYSQYLKIVLMTVTSILLSTWEHILSANHSRHFLSFYSIQHVLFHSHQPSCQAEYE
jgi:hypothetical protein